MLVVSCSLTFICIVFGTVSKATNCCRGQLFYHKGILIIHYEENCVRKTQVGGLGGVKQKLRPLL